MLQKQALSYSSNNIIINKPMSQGIQKYTKFCNAQTLIKAIQANQKDEQSMHILLSVFKKPLHWVQQKFKREGLFDAINKITVRKGPIRQPLAWIYAIKQNFWYYDMPFGDSEFVHFTFWNEKYVKYQYTGVYAVLTQKNYQQMNNLSQARQIDSIKKFIKSNVFYPYYLQESNIQQFISLIRIKKLKYNMGLNWKDEDGSHKIAVIFRGLLSIEYPWKRNIEVAQLTRGMFITNHYIKDAIEEIQEFQLEQVDPKPKVVRQFPKYKYISKSDDTILLIFNVRLIKQEPFNVNPDILPLIKKNFAKYGEGLDKIINFDEMNKLHRNKSSIKEEVRRKQVRNGLKKDQSFEMYKTSTSPIMRTIVNVDFDSTPFETVKTIQLPEPVKPFSKTIFTSISPQKNRHQRSYSTEQVKNLSHKRLIHNTFVEQAGKKKENSKSFSTLQTLTTYHPDKHKKQTQLQDEINRDEKPAFFIPDQFVKKKLRMKYEELVNKVRKMDLTIKKNYEENINEKLQKLQGYVESKRIVRINNAKRKFRFLRDRVQY